jgi:hypothetical protein
MLKRVLGIVVVYLFLSVPGYAQTLGTITSEVKDTSGATIPGAMVSDVPRQPHSEQSEESDLAEAARVLPHSDSSRRDQ